MYHGPGPKDRYEYEGPMQVSGGPFRSARLENEFIAALDQAGWPELEDNNDLDSVDGVMRAMRYVDPLGTAVSAVHKANPAFQPPSVDGAQPPSRTTRAKRMAILAGGPFGSPLLLERSGIGDPKILERAGVPLVTSLPGVGHDYLDHHGMMYPYKSSIGPDETVDAFNVGRLDPATLIAKGDKFLSWNSVDAQAKLRPTDVNIAKLGF